MINILIIDISDATGYTACHMATTTRDTILHSLRAQGKCTVRELAQIVGISPVSVRHHLANLKADGLIFSEEVRHGVGRPYHLFSLTDEALELFPTRFFRLTNLLMDEIKSQMPQEQVEALLLRIAKSIVDDHKETFENLPIEVRLPYLRDLLFNEGFETIINLHENQIVIQMLNCPFTHLPQHHPEVCMIERSIIAQALSVPVELITCNKDESTYCVIAIPLDSGDT